MSSIYPSLEDMQVHKMVQAQHDAFDNHIATQQATYPSAGYPSMPSAPKISENDALTVYPGLADFMGLELSSATIALNMPEYMRNENSIVQSTAGSMIAPLSSQSVGLQRAQVNHGIREVILCKGTDNKFGLRVKDINNGIFITLVCKDSPASLVG